MPCCLLSSTKPSKENCDRRRHTLLKPISPKLRSTTTGAAPWEWLPESFPNFLEEAEHIQAHCKELDHLVIYRGHGVRKWLLDSTFARSCKKYVFGMESWQKIRFDEFRMFTNHQQILLNLFFFKFDFVARPSNELFELEKKYGIDPGANWGSENILVLKRQDSKARQSEPRAAPTSSGSVMKAWKNPIISPIPMSSPRKSSKTSKLLSNNFVRSPLIYASTCLRKKIGMIGRWAIDFEIARVNSSSTVFNCSALCSDFTEAFNPNVTTFEHLDGSLWTK
jgi:hypothetical protein